jgi:hypothetical protein
VLFSHNNFYYPIYPLFSFLLSFLFYTQLTNWNHSLSLLSCSFRFLLVFLLLPHSPIQNIDELLANFHRKSSPSLAIPGAEILLIVIPHSFRHHLFVSSSLRLSFARLQIEPCHVHCPVFATPPVGPLPAYSTYPSSVQACLSTIFPSVTLQRIPPTRRCDNPTRPTKNFHSHLKRKPVN